MPVAAPKSAPLPAERKAAVDFDAWNNRLAAHFFRPWRAGRRVRLYVTRDLLDRFGAPRVRTLTTS